MITTIFLSAVFCFVCGVLIFKSSFFYVDAFSKRSLAALFILKAIAGIVIGHFSFRIFSGNDSWFYFDEGKRLYLVALENPRQYIKLMLGIVDSSNQFYYSHFLNKTNLSRLYNSETMIKLNSLFHFISFHHYSVHSVLFSFISFCGLTGFYKFFCSLFKTSSEPLFFLLVFSPSLLIWTSGIAKDGLLVGAAGLFVFYLLDLSSSKKTLAKVLATALLLLFLFLVKSYFIFLLIPVLVSFFIISKKPSGKTRTIATYCSVIVLYLITFSVCELFTHQPPLPYAIALKQQSAMKYAVFKNAQSFSKPPVIASSWHSVINNSPQAFMHTLGKPAFAFHNSFLQNMAALETYFFALLLLYGLLKSLGSHSLHFNFALLCLIFVFLFYVIVGYTSATEGTIARLKTPALPFILMLFYSLFLKSTYLNTKT